MPLFSRRRRASTGDAPPAVAGDPTPPADGAVDADPVTAAADDLSGVDPAATATDVDPAAADPADPVDDPADPVDPADLADPADASGVPGAGSPVSLGDAVATGPLPRDVSEADPAADFLDLGAIRLPTADDVLEGIEIQLQADPETEAVMSLLLVDGPEKALELRAFAAPRHEGLWDEVRDEIATEAGGAGGLTQAVAGRWGDELLIQVAVTLPDGQEAVQVTRFVGIDGPRWFLRGAFLGRAAIEPDTATRLDAILAGVTVVRGNEAMAPRDPLRFVIPGQPAGAADLPADGGRPPLEPFERGPEITEVR